MVDVSVPPEQVAAFIAAVVARLGLSADDVVQGSVHVSFCSPDDSHASVEVTCWLPQAEVIELFNSAGRRL